MRNQQAARASLGDVFGEKAGRKGRDR